jgi:hypothetical protein
MRNFIGALALAVLGLFAINLSQTATAQVRRSFPTVPTSGGGVPTTRTIATTAPLGGGGSLAGNLTLTCATCAIVPNIDFAGAITIGATSATTVAIGRAGISASGITYNSGSGIHTFTGNVFTTGRFDKTGSMQLGTGSATDIIMGNNAIGAAGITINSGNGAQPIVINGRLKNVSGNEATAATAGANGAVPSQVAGYIIFADSAGTTRKIPYFNN